jgi:hypothetical protein
MTPFSSGLRRTTIVRGCFWDGTQNKRGGITVATALVLLVWIPVTTWYLWCNIRYRRAKGMSAIGLRVTSQSLAATFRRQPDPNLESLRRRLLLAGVLFYVCVFFGVVIWWALPAR